MRRTIAPTCRTAYLQLYLTRGSRPNIALDRLLGGILASILAITLLIWAVLSLGGSLGTPFLF